MWAKIEDKRPPVPRRWFRKRTMLFLGITSVLSAAATYALTSPQHGRRALVLDGVQGSPTWAQYSPFRSLEAYEVPSGCSVTQVNHIERHGARFPTDGATKRIRSAVDKLVAAGTYTNETLSFLSDYTYDLGVSHLLPFGAAQANDSGATSYERYAHLLNADSLPFVRASGSERVIDTAQNWTEGFSLASNHVYSPPLSVILSEEGNDTLDDNLCANIGDSDAQTEEWIAAYAPPITTRLNADAPGANLTDADIYNLMSLCAFETLAKETESDFCPLFTAEEFLAFAYVGDLDKYYGTGYGQELGPVQGVGYINELIARLTGQPVQDATQTNSTLDSDPATFPLDRALYADFSHDNQMIAIYAALGLFPQDAPLSTAGPEEGRTWKVDELVPFSARMVTEKFVCDGDATEYVRILVNDAVQPLAFCGDGSGRCTVEAFVESQTYARENGQGDWEKCFV
ncbi:acid phosphatase [Cylindrobasidium torrendii FP15055 ss-10]|uniref:Phytase A n=1 Tax=Cylindrobasidium torrendii FP15055 ss-10 TaxID=1314674 RepID=A0A0D7B3I3_9AGAR|nr:acid phosphatase [Cylindrobasidium torrendii FP15055 ss-10]